MAIKISGETVVDDSKKGLFNDVVVKGGAGESGEITLNCENNSHGVKLKGPAHSAGADYTLTLPETSGSNGEVLTTDGSGAMSWEEVVGNEISATAPTSPSQGALWTDTSEDPAAPILKTWNGSAWVAVGSAAPSEFAPVINNVTLTENDTTGDRFTSQTFDVDLTMLVEGNPHSQKELKGEVTASFEQRPSSEPVTSNNAVAFPNNNRSSNQNSFSQNGFQYVPVWAPGLSEGTYEWYTYSFPYGSGSNGSFITVDIDNITSIKETVINNSISLSGANRLKYGKYYPPSAGDAREWIVIWTDTDPSDDCFRAYRYPGQQWYAGWSSYSRPWFDEETGKYFWYYDRKIFRGDQWGSSEAKTGTIGYTSNNGTGSIAVGNGKVMTLRAYNANSYSVTWDKNYTEDSGNYTQTHFASGYEAGKWVDFVNGYFWISTNSSTLYRSYDGSSWSNVSIPRFNGASGSIEVDYIDVDPNNPGTIRAWCLAWSNGNTGTHQRYIMTSNNNGATWVATWGSPKSRDYFTECIPLFGDGKVVFVDNGDDNGYNRMGADIYPYSEQTVTLQGTGEGYSEFNVGDLIRKAGTTGYEYEGQITSISGSDIGLNSPYIYQAGDVIEAKYPTSSGIATRYLIIESTGAVTGTIGSDPGYVSMSPDVNQTLTFPATFASGDTPDDELPVGTTIKVSAKATNSEGSSEFGPSNIVTPS